MKRLMRALLAFSLAFGVALPASVVLHPTAAQAKPDKDPLRPTIRVLTPAGKPVATASLRHPDEGVRHPVNTATGEYSPRSLFLDDGSEVTFFKGMILVFEVSAPGFQNTTAQFTLRRRNNDFEVVLQPLDLDPPDLDDGPNIRLQRDEPLDGR